MVAVRQRRELDADDEEDEAARGKREGDRISEQQEDHERRKHDRRHVVRDEICHLRCSGRSGSAMMWIIDGAVPARIVPALLGLFLGRLE